MSLGMLLLAVWLILQGVSGLGWLAVSAKFLAVWALVTGIVLIVEHWHPLVTVPLHRGGANPNPQ